MAKVKFKFGTWAKFSAIQNKDTDTLYFITDKGVFYKGDQPYVGIVSAVVTDSGSNANNVAVMTLTDSLGNTVTFSVPSSTALAAVKTALENSLTSHASQIADDRHPGHVTLSDTYDDHYGASAGIAATPAAVQAAYNALLQIINNSFAANDAMVFRGTLGTGGSVASLPEYGFSAGWTYRVATAGTYAGKPCEPGDLVIAVVDGPAEQSDPHSVSQENQDSYWTAVQVNIDGAVTASRNLADGQLVVGDGNTKNVKKLPAGTNGQILKMVNGVPTWCDITDADEKVTVEDTGTTDMYIVGVASPTGNQRGKSKSILKLTGGEKLEAPKFKGDGSEVTNLDPSNLSSAVPVSKGGTGSTTASGARTNLGLGSAAVKDVAQSIGQNETGLTTGAQVYNAIDAAAPAWEELQ